MAVQVIDDLVTDVTAYNTVVDGAIAAFDGFAKRLDDAIAAALAGGATKTELAPLASLSTEVKAKKQALADAILANTPVPPPPEPPV